jgi:flagellar hook-basal body protein
VQVGIGASISSVRQQFTQGNIVTTSNPLDVAINGGGFFRLSTNGISSYARNGQFALDRDGYIVTNSGARLTGYQADGLGQIVASTPSDLRISLANISTSPGGIFGFTVPSGRARTLHKIFNTNSLRTDSAMAKASFVSGSITIWAMPSRSRKSINITPPWSRRRCAQPQRVTVCPISSRFNWPQ